MAKRAQLKELKRTVPHETYILIHTHLIEHSRGGVLVLGGTSSRRRWRLRAALRPLKCPSPWRLRWLILVMGVVKVMVGADGGGGRYRLCLAAASAGSRAGRG